MIRSCADPLAGLCNDQNQIVVPGLRATGSRCLIYLPAIRFLLGTTAAIGGSMIDVALSILALIAGGLTLELFAAAWPPLGHQEDRRFNFRTEALDTVEELQIGNPS
jgi:hypothetical protein